MHVGDQKYRVLMVDDEADLASLYVARLEAEGFEAIYCREGENALQIARTFKPDVIILDLMMPRLSGFDAIELFRNTLETRAACIVILSALSQPEDIARTKALGADDYIVKSEVPVSGVIERVKKALAQSTGNKSLTTDNTESQTQ